MTSENTTSSDTPSSISEKELFKEFLNSEIVFRTGERASVRALLGGFAETSSFVDAMDNIRTDIENDPDPTFALEMLLGDLRSIAADVEVVKTRFEWLKMQRYIEAKGRDEFGEDRRYRPSETPADEASARKAA